MPRISQPALSQDGEKLAYTVTRGELGANRWRPEIQVVGFGDESVEPWSVVGHSPQWVEDQLYFLSVRSGRQQVWRQAGPGQVPAMVTDLPIEVEAFRLSPDGSRLAVELRLHPKCAQSLECSAERKASSRGVAVYDDLLVRHQDRWLDGFRSTVLCVALSRLPLNSAALNDHLSAALTVPESAPLDARFLAEDRLVFVARESGPRRAWSTNQDLWLSACEPGARPVNLTANNPAGDRAPRLSADGRYMVWLSQARAGLESDRWRILRRELSSGHTQEMSAGWDRSPETIEISEDANTVWAIAEDHGRQRLFRVDAISGQVEAQTGDGAVDALTLSKDQRVIQHSQLDQPGALFRAQGRHWQRLTAPSQPRAELVRPQWFWFSGWNDESVQGRVIPPRGRKPGTRYPVILMLHGGPQQSMGDDFALHWNPQLFSARGFAVVAIDFHGSTGYGQAFTGSVSKDWAGKPLEDLRKGWAAAQRKFAWLDGERACVVGSSYGAYLVNLIAGRWPDQFKCGVAHAGIFNLRAFAMSSDERWFVDADLGEPDSLAPQDPSRRLDDWRMPVLFSHGSRDFRVPVSQSVAAFTALRSRDIRARLMHFEHEGHSLRGPASLLQWYRAVFEWLDEQLTPSRSDQP